MPAYCVRRRRPPGRHRAVAMRYRWSERWRTGPDRDASRPRCRMGYPPSTGSISRGQASSSVPRVDGRPPLRASHARRLAKIHGRRPYRGLSSHARRCRPRVLDGDDGMSVLSSRRRAGTHPATEPAPMAGGSGGQTCTVISAGRPSAATAVRSAIRSGAAGPRHDRAASMGAWGPGRDVIAITFDADSCRATVGACRLGTTFGILFRQSGGRDSS